MVKANKKVKANRIKLKRHWQNPKNKKQPPKQNKKQQTPEPSHLSLHSTSFFGSIFRIKF